jgi:hypothetical protein
MLYTDPTCFFFFSIKRDMANCPFYRDRECAGPRTHTFLERFVSCIHFEQRQVKIVCPTKKKMAKRGGMFFFPIPV